MPRYSEVLITYSSAGGEDAVDLALGLLDAVGIHGMGGEDTRNGAGLALLERLEFFEDADGAVGIVTGGVEVLQAEVVGFRLVLAGEVEESRRDAEHWSPGGRRCRRVHRRG